MLNFLNLTSFFSESSPGRLPFHVWLPQHCLFFLTKPIKSSALCKILGYGTCNVMSKLGRMSLYILYIYILFMCVRDN